jgi:hypothetical protein
MHECTEKLFSLLSVEVLRLHKELNASPRFELQDSGVMLYTMAYRLAVQTAWLRLAHSLTHSFVHVCVQSWSPRAPMKCMISPH